MISASMSEASPAARSLSGRVARVIATGLGSGYSPIAPGTAGSLVGLLFFWPLAGVPLVWLAVAIVGLFFVGVAASTAVAAQVGLHDPGIVVVDEVVGMWVTLVLVPFTPLTAALGFLLFRLMDVVKPFPARDLEHLPGGWGIVADDVMAGIYANLALRLGLYLWS